MLPTLYSNPTQWLMQEYRKRRDKNPRFSLRSFAKVLEMQPGRLSELMSGKRALSIALVDKITDRLDYTPAEKHNILDLVLHNKKQITQPTETHYEPLPDDLFQVIADWYHFAILNLVKTRSFQNNPRWIASRLAISPIEARDATNRLLKLGYLKEIGGRLQRQAPKFSTTYDIPSSALRRSHRQSLEQAIDALESVPVTDRDITSITFAADPKHLSKVKQAIKQFQRDVAALMEKGDLVEVYNLNVQLVPVTKKEKMP